MTMERHGGNIHQYEREMLDFSANIHPDGMPWPVYQAAQKALKEAVHYPDPQCVKLKETISQKHGVKPEQIICGNGAADLIFRLALVRKAKKILLPAPAFVEYEEAFAMPVLEQPCIIEYPMGFKTFDLKEDLLSYMDASIDLMIVCNPNNPTGRLVDGDLLTRILKKAKKEGIFLLLDECFLDFVVGGKEHSMIPVRDAFPNVFILRSFTKMYGMPGIRLGYGVSSNEKLLDQMNGSAQSWSVSHVAQQAGIAACQMKGYEEKTAKEVRELRQWLYQQLNKLPVRVLKGEANYLFFQVPGCTSLTEQCLDYGICIRHCHNYRNLGQDYYRVAVRKQEENRQLIHVLCQVLERKEQ